MGALPVLPCRETSNASAFACRPSKRSQRGAIAGFREVDDTPVFLGPEVNDLACFFCQFTDLLLNYLVVDDLVLDLFGDFEKPETIRLTRLHYESLF